MAEEPIPGDGSANRTRVGGRREGTGMIVTTTGLVRASAVLFGVAAALFAAGFVVADRAAAGSDGVPVAETGEVAPTVVVPTGDPAPAPAPTTTPAQDAAEPVPPVVVETQVVTVTVPVVTTVVADPTVPAATDRTTSEPAPSTAATSSAPAEPAVTPSEPDATEPPDVGSRSGGSTAPSP